MGPVGRVPTNSGDHGDGRGDGPKASTSWASEAARAKAELDCATLWVCFAYMLKPAGSIHISCLVAREQTSAAQISKASPPYNMKYFYSFFLALSFNSIFIFFDWSGPVRVLVPSYRSPRQVYWSPPTFAAGSVFFRWAMWEAPRQTCSLNVSGEGKKSRKKGMGETLVKQ